MAFMFDPTNPRRQRRRFAADGQGIGGAFNATKPKTAAKPSPVVDDLSARGAPGNGIADVRGSPTTGARASTAAKSVGASRPRVFAPRVAGMPRYVQELGAPGHTGAAPGDATGWPTLNQGLNRMASHFIPAGMPQPTAQDLGLAEPMAAGRIPATPPPIRLASPAEIAASKSPPVAAAGMRMNPSTVADLRAINPAGIPDTPRNAMVDQGVTLPDGRKLSYGAMVDGVPTFSDGSGGIGDRPGSIPRTMTDAEIKGLGDRLPSVPAGTAPAAFASPVAFNSDNSEANIANIMRGREGGRFGTTPEMEAATDLADIINQNPRSTLGRAALNASRRAGGATTVLQRKQALGALNGLERSAAAGGLADINNAAAAARGNAANAALLGRTDLAGQLDLAGINARNTGELANTGLAGQYQVLASAARSNPNTLTDKDLNAEAVKLLPQILGLDPAGQIIDPQTHKPRNPTQAEIAAGLQRAREALMPRQATPGPGNASPYAEGARLKGPDGKIYVVKNGTPVLAQ